MKCDRCNCKMESGDEREWNGQTVCEDCYMDLLSPNRPCDPWAAMAAKSACQLSGGEAEVTESQQRILDILEQAKMPLEELAEKSGLEIPDLERDLAALHRMEKTGARLIEGQKIFQLWLPGDENNPVCG